jgi:hypothetical protein
MKPPLQCWFTMGMRHSGGEMSCHEVEKAVAYLYDELAPQERAAFDAHLRECAGCREFVEQSRQVHELLVTRARPEPTPELLVRCRQQLDHALDREQLGWHGLFHALHRVLGAGGAARTAVEGVGVVLMLIALGFGLGWTLRPLPVTRIIGPAPEPNRVAAELLNSRINNITQVAPDPQTGGVKITVNAERRVTVEGSLDDPRIRQLLVNTVKGYDNPGIRRDTLDVLRAQTENPSVRAALLYAMRHDANAGVRREALRTVQGLEWGPDVEHALLEAVDQETNAGVKFAAIDTVTDHAAKTDDTKLLPTLEQWAAADSDQYVRMKSRMVIRQLTNQQ